MQNNSENKYSGTNQSSRFAKGREFKIPSLIGEFSGTTIPRFLSIVCADVSVSRGNSFLVASFSLVLSVSSD